MNSLLSATLGPRTNTVGLYWKEQQAQRSYRPQPWSVSACISPWCQQYSPILLPDGRTDQTHSSCEDEERSLAPSTEVICHRVPTEGWCGGREKKKKKEKEEETWITLCLSFGSRPFVGAGRRHQSDVKRLLLDLRPPLRT